MRDKELYGGAGWHNYLVGTNILYHTKNKGYAKSKDRQCWFFYRQCR